MYISLSFLSYYSALLFPHYKFLLEYMITTESHENSYFKTISFHLLPFQIKIINFSNEIFISRTKLALYIFSLPHPSHKGFFNKSLVVHMYSRAFSQRRVNDRVMRVVTRILVNQRLTIIIIIIIIFLFLI